MRNLLILLSMFFLVALGCNKEESPEPKEEKGLFVLNDKQIKVDGIIYNRYNPNVAKQDTGVYVDTKGEFYIVLPYCDKSEISCEIVTKPSYHSTYSNYVPPIAFTVKCPSGGERHHIYEDAPPYFLMNRDESSCITMDYEKVKDNVVKKGIAKQYFIAYIRRTEFGGPIAFLPIKYRIKLSGEGVTKVNVEVNRHVDVTNMKGKNYYGWKW